MDIELTIGKNITDGFVYFLQCTERAHFKCEVLLQHWVSLGPRLLLNGGELTTRGFQSLQLPAD